MGQNQNDLLRLLSPDGFIKITEERSADLPSAQKAALIRKGNELFNAGEIKQAARIFITTSYSDGLIRVGDYYLKNGKPYEAVRFFWLSKSPDHISKISQRMAIIIREWLEEEE
jgi:hypothetical protein